MTLKKKGDPIPHEAVMLKHPQWEEVNDRLKFHRDAYHGSGTFAADPKPYTTADVPITEDQWKAIWVTPPSFEPTQLQPFHRERAGFKFRIRRSHYVNIIKPAVLILLGFLLRRKPVRKEYDKMPGVVEWMKAVTVKGLSFDDWLKTELGPVMAWAGEAISVMDRERSAADSKAEQDADPEKARMIARVIDPTQIMDWSIDDRGRYRWLKIKQRVDNTEDPMATAHTIVDRFTWYTREGWYCVDVPVSAPAGSGTANAATAYTVKDGAPWPNELSQAPITAWRIGEAGQSLIQDAAPAARAKFNMDSLVASMVYESGFNILVGPPRARQAGDKGKGEDIGSANYFPEVYEDGQTGKGVRFEAPSAGPAETVMKIADMLAREIHAMIGLGILDQSSSTGPAKRFDFANLNAYLGSLVGDFAEGEHETIKIAAQMHGDTYTADMRAIYPRNFEPVDIEALLKSLDQYRIAGAPAKVIAEGLKNALPAIIPTLTETELEAMAKHIDDAAAMSAAACLGDGPDDLDDDDEPPEDDGTAIPKTPEQA